MYMIHTSATKAVFIDTVGSEVVVCSGSDRHGSVCECSSSGCGDFTLIPITLRQLVDNTATIDTPLYVFTSSFLIDVISVDWQYRFHCHYAFFRRRTLITLSSADSRAIAWLITLPLRRRWHGLTALLLILVDAITPHWWLAISCFAAYTATLPPLVGPLRSHDIIADTPYAITPIPLYVSPRWLASCRH